MDAQLSEQRDAGNSCFWQIKCGYLPLLCDFVSCLSQLGMSAQELDEFGWCGLCSWP